MDYISALESALGKSADIEMLPMQPGDMPDTYADVSNLIGQFNYQPSTPVDRGVANFVSWYRNYFNS
jgi:UDP-glucuronate 4-epimerase